MIASDYSVRRSQYNGTRFGLKLVIILNLILTLVFLPCQRASAPVPVGLGVALKCVAIGVIIPTAIIIWKCDQEHYLVRYQLDGEDPWWSASKANETTNGKLGGRRCEGPWSSPDEPAFRAWVNNKDPGFPVFPCGPLGKIPGPNTNAPAFISLQQSRDGGASWTPLVSTTADPGDNLSFVVFLTNAGTNGLTADQLRQVQDCDVAVTNSAASPSAMFRLAGREIMPTAERHQEQ